MKNLFYFILKALFVLKIFKLLSCFLVMLLTSKCMTSQAGQQISAIHALPIISRSKGNQTIKICQLTEHKKRNLFLQKSCRKRERLVPDLFVFLKIVIEKGLEIVAPPHFVCDFSINFFSC